MHRRHLFLGSAGVFLTATGVASMLAAPKSLSGLDHPSDTCTDRCGDCRTACLACVAQCLEESGRKECIRLCLDCADLCAACESIAARKGPMRAAVMKLCAEACNLCAAECEKHTDDKACAACAAACRACAKECLAEISP